MNRWGDAATWVGEGLHREVFYFGPEKSRLYGSLYSAEPLSRHVGVVVCPSWGYEADRTERLAHRIALTAAQVGGAGMIFHYPGHGDSHGASLADATLDSLADAAACAIEEAARRRPAIAWFPVGLMIGAAVACIAQRRSALATDRLLLVQPELSPSAYFGRLAKSAQRVTLGSGRINEMSFAYPLPPKVLAAGTDSDAQVLDALDRFAGDGVVVRYANPPSDGTVPDTFTCLTVDGSWRFGAKDYPALELGIEEWLAGPSL